MSETDDEQDGEIPRLYRERLRLVDQMLRACMAHGTIERMCGKDWDVGPRQVRKYIRAVYKLWDRDAKRTGTRYTELRRAQLEGVLEAAMSGVDPDHAHACTSRCSDPCPQRGTFMPKPDVKAATMALHRLCLLDGIYGPSKVEHSGSITTGPDVETMRSSDREAELKDLLAKYEARRAMTKTGTSGNH